MSILFCLLLSSQGILIGNVIAEKIPPVQLKLLIGTDNANGFIIQWDPVERKDGNDPIIGYKVKLWTAPCVNKTAYTFDENGQFIKEVTSIREKWRGNVVPDDIPDVYIVPAKKRECKVPHILLAVWYHIRVLAFTRTAEGPLSDSYQFAFGLGKAIDKTCNSTIRTPSLRILSTNKIYD